MKKCAKCKILKDEVNFSKNSQSKSGLKSYCKTCNSIIEKSSYFSGKDSDRKRLQLYSCSIEQYKSMMLEQNGACKICGKTNIKLCVDHCHISKKIRGLLCRLCNGFLGKINDNIETLNKVKEYLAQ